MANLKPPLKSVEKDEKAVVSTVKTVEKAKSKIPTEQVPPDAIKPLQLKIPESKKNEFKAYAAMRGRSMNALFLDMFDEYKSNNT
jgi:hypothetical protein